MILPARRRIPAVSFVQAVISAARAPSCGLFDGHCQPELIVGQFLGAVAPRYAARLSATISAVSQVLGSLGELSTHQGAASVTIDAGPTEKTIAMRVLDILSPGRLRWTQVLRDNPLSLLQRHPRLRHRRACVSARGRIRRLLA